MQTPSSDYPPQHPPGNEESILQSLPSTAGAEEASSHQSALPQQPEMSKAPPKNGRWGAIVPGSYSEFVNDAFGVVEYDEQGYPISKEPIVVQTLSPNDNDGQEVFDDWLHHRPENDRNNFIQKVYGILSLQLGITVLFVGLVVLIEPLREGIRHTYPVVLTCMGLSFVLLIAIGCFRSLARTHPYGLIALIVFTVLESYMVAFTCAFYSPIIVLVAALMTFGITVALTLYAWKTTRDFTTCRGIVFALCAGLLLYAFFLIFLYSKIVHLTFCLVAVLMYSFFIVYDTQLIAGGKYDEVDYDDYILGALMLYVDIIGLFLYLLSLMGSRE